MNASRITLLLILLGIIAIGISFWQYRLYRIPPTETITSLKENFEAELQSGGTQRDSVPPIDNPKFESVRTADQYLKDEGFGLDVKVGGEHRFYPYQILVWHEIINETLNNKPLLITYSPLTLSGIVFERELNGEEVEFGTSGKLWNNNLVMYDRNTETLWSQILGKAIIGENKGKKLIQYPALTVSWKKWKEEYPNGLVLSRNTGYIRDYTRDPYGNYYNTQDILFPLTKKDLRLPIKELIHGLSIGEIKKAYPDKIIREQKEITDIIGDKEIRIFIDEDLGATRATSDNEEFLLISSYWFSWVSSFPETKLYEQ